MPKWTTAEDQQLLTSLANGESLDQIGLKLGKSPSMVDNRRVKLLAAAISNGQLLDDVCKMYNTDPKMLAARINRYAEKKVKSIVKPPAKEKNKQKQVKVNIADSLANIQDSLDNLLKLYGELNAKLSK